MMAGVYGAPPGSGVVAEGRSGGGTTGYRMLPLRGGGCGGRWRREVAEGGSGGRRRYFWFFFAVFLFQEPKGTTPARSAQLCHSEVIWATRSGCWAARLWDSVRSCFMS